MDGWVNGLIQTDINHINASFSAVKTHYFSNAATWNSFGKKKKSDPNVDISISVTQSLTWLWQVLSEVERKLCARFLFHLGTGIQETVA